MKNFIQISIVLIILFFSSSCGALFEYDQHGCRENQVFIDGACVKKKWDNAIEEKGIYSLVNQTEEFELDSDSLTLYEHPSYPSMDFIEIESFMEALSGALIDLEIQHFDNSMVILHTSENPDDPENDFMTGIEILYRENIIYFSDINLLDYMNEMDQEITSNIELEVSDYIPGIVDMSIYLDDYDFDIIYNQGNYYLPLSLANLFLTGSYINLYLDDTEIHVLSDLASFSEFDTVNRSVSDEDEKYLLEETKDYTALFFNYFYGLKEYKNIEDFRDEFTEYGLYDTTTLANFDELLGQYIFDLEDFHTNIIDYGYNHDHVDEYGFSLGRKTIDFYTYYFDNCEVKTENSFTEFDTYYVLSLIVFDEETPEYLETTLSELDPTMDIYVDLSCNSGGILYSALDILQYMTNEPIEMTMMNPLTDEIITTTVDMDEIQALPNIFYLYTSQLTYSAANLLSQVVQENGISNIVGSQTSGGSASVKYAVLPNNFAFTYSSNILFVDDENQPLEHGVNPDFPIEIDYFHFIERETIKQFNNIADINVVDHSLSTFIDVEFEIDFLSNDFEYISTEVEVWDVLSGDLIHQTEIEQSNYHYQFSLDIDSKLVKTRLIMNYLIDGEVYRYVYLKDTYDELSGEINSRTLELDFSNQYVTYVHKGQDKDIFKLVLNEHTVIDVLIESEHSIFDVIVYNEFGDEIEEGRLFSLPAGTYYFEVNGIETYLAYEEYTIELFELNDDNPAPLELILTEGITNITLEFEYQEDQESLYFYLPEESIIEINWNDNTPYYYSINYVQNDEIYEMTGRLHKDTITYLLPEGMYYLELAKEVVGTTLNATIDIEFKTDEISGSLTQQDPTYRTLHFGSNSIRFDEMGDADIYVFTVLESTTIRIGTTSLFDIAIFNQDGINVKIPFNSNQTLEPGTYYFRLQSFTGDFPRSDWIEITNITDYD